MPTPSPIRITDLEGSIRHERFSHPRLKILQATEKRPHRYRWIRALTMSVTLGLLFLVPLSGLAAFDLYGGEHRALFRPVTAFVGLVAVAIAIFSFYFVTFQANLVAGRMFCGFGCPVGQLNRLTDAVSASRGRMRALWNAALVGFALLLASAVSLWWFAPAAFADPRFMALPIAAVFVMTAAGVALARVYGWAFCEKACPIGLYYSVVQQRRPIGILFDRSKCLDEAACVKACPVHLEPRDLAAPKIGIGGFAIEELAANNHCLRCGACVEACELVTSKVGGPALSFGRPADVVAEPIAEAPVIPARQTEAPEPIAPEAAPLGKKVTIAAVAAVIAVALCIGAYLQAFGGARYRPVATWDQASKAPKNGHAYRPAASAFTGQTLDGSVTRGAAPASGVIVVWPTPEPGAALPPGRTIPIFGAVGEWPAHDLVSTVLDTLVLDNEGDRLHTFHLSKNGRAVRQLPIPPHSERSLPAPPAGEYELRCDSHPGEAVTLLVVDHPYFAVTDESGKFSLHDLPRTPNGLKAIGDSLSLDMKNPNQGTLQP